MAELFCVDDRDETGDSGVCGDRGRLFISGAFHDWAPIHASGIDVVIDLEGDLDPDVPTKPDGVLYIYFPIHDGDLPNLTKLHAVGALGASLLQSGHCVLSHCTMGFNRSALLAGVILNQMGCDGPRAIEQIRRRREGALWNEVFEEYLRGLRGTREQSTPLE